MEYIIFINYILIFIKRFYAILNVTVTLLSSCLKCFSHSISFYQKCLWKNLSLPTLVSLYNDCFDLIDFEFILILLALAFRHLEPCHSRFFPQGFFFSDYFYTFVCLLQCHCPKRNLVLLQSTISVSFVYVSMIFVRHGLSSPYKIMPSLGYYFDKSMCRKWNLVICKL